MLAGSSLFETARVEPGTEHAHTLLSGEGEFALEKVVSAPGYRSPEGFWYDQDFDEWVLLASGEATLELEDGERLELEPGDHLLIPRHRRHRILRTGEHEPTVWLTLRTYREEL